MRIDNTSAKKECHNIESIMTQNIYMLLLKCIVNRKDCVMLITHNGKYCNTHIDQRLVM